MTWRLLRSGPGAPAWNQACDEALLRSDNDLPVLRLYGWEPAALSLGFFQPLESFVEPAARAGLTIVRRPTGGGAIHHDDELTFCLVASPGRDGYPADLVAAYEWVHGVVGTALASLGARTRARGGDVPLSVRPAAASLCFQDTTALDLVDDDGRKVVGSAQRRMGGRVLHHGSVPLSVPTLSPGSGCVSGAAGRRVSWHEAADAVTRAFAEALPEVDWVPGTLDEAERSMARRLVDERYGDPAIRPRRGSAGAPSRRSP